MGAASVARRRGSHDATRRGAHASSPRRAIAPADAAWIALAPCALLTLAAILLLAPALGDVLFPPSSVEFWPVLAGDVAPEPAEHTSFLLALAGVVLLSGAVVANLRRPLELSPRRRRLLVGIGQAALCAF